MESQLVRRRMNTIAGHFVTTVADDIAAAASHIFPLNCSSILNSVIRRCDNRMHFARQGSSSQACFMRQASTSTEQVSSAQSCVYLNKSCGSANEGSSNAFEAPLFSRPIARMQQNYPNVSSIQPVVEKCKSAPPEPPKFSRPNRKINEQLHSCSRNRIHPFQSTGLEWSPRMDVAESGCNYILTVELPGVNINDIRVEINDQILTVVAKNSNQCWRVASSNDTYHKREISQGPYKVVWTLPSNLNKDGVSAEFVLFKKITNTQVIEAQKTTIIHIQKCHDKRVPMMNPQVMILVGNLELKLKALGIILFANFVDITLKVGLRVSNNI